jgi:hypothetical protein
MNKIIIYYVLILSFFSCSGEKNSLEILNEKVVFFERNERIFYKDVRINILRIGSNSKKHEYELRKNNFEGFAVFQTNPNVEIYDNIPLNPINLKLVENIKNFNNKNSVLLLLENNQKTTKLLFKIDDNTVLLFRADSIIHDKSSQAYSILKLKRNWYYNVEPFIGEI